MPEFDPEDHWTVQSKKRPVFVPNEGYVSYDRAIELMQWKVTEAEYALAYYRGRLQQLEDEQAGTKETP